MDKQAIATLYEYLDAENAQYEPFDSHNNYHILGIAADVIAKLINIDAVIKKYPNCYWGYLRKAILLKENNHAQEAIEVLEKGIGFQEDDSLYLTKAEILLWQHKLDEAWDIYEYVETRFPEVHLSFLIYKKAIICQTKEFYDMALELCQTYLAKYPVENEQDFAIKAPIYYIIIESLFDLKRDKEGQEIWKSIEKYKSQENILLKYIFLKKSGQEIKAEELMEEGRIMDDSLSSYYPSPNREIPYTKNLYDEGIYFAANPFNAEKYYIKAHLFLKGQEVRNDITQLQIYPFPKQYSPDLPILQTEQEAAFFVWKNLVASYERVGRIVHFLEKGANLDKPVIEFYCWGDRWYGDLQDIIKTLKILAPYLEDGHFFFTDYYLCPMYEMRITEGVFYLNIGYREENEHIDNYINKRMAAQINELPYAQTFLDTPNSW